MVVPLPVDFQSGVNTEHQNEDMVVRSIEILENLEWAGAAINVKNFLAVGDGVANDQPAIQAAVNYAATVGNRDVFIPAGTYLIASRVTVPANVTLRGAGIGSSILRVTSNDRVVVLGDGAALIGVQADANHQQDTGLPQKLSAVQAGSSCYIENVWARNAYTGFATAGTDNYFLNLRSTDHASRGISLTPGALRNIVDGLYASNCLHAGIIFGGASSGNIIRNFVIQRMTLPGVWFHEGSFGNVVCDGYISNPVDATVAALSFTPGAHQNTCSNIYIAGHDKAVQFESNLADTSQFPGLLDHETDRNIVEKIIAIGNGTSLAYAVSFSQVNAAGPNCTNNVVRNCYFENFYGVFFNNSDAADGCEFSDIRTSSIGAGGVMKGMKSNGLNTIKLHCIEGFPLKVSITSGTFTIDSTGNKNVDTGHGLLYTPPNTKIAFTVLRNTAVTDFRIDNIMCPTVSASTMNIRVQVGAASVTGGATARLAINIDMQAEEGFLTSLIT